MAATEQTFVVVSDSVGFVGAFADVAEAQTALLPYLGVPFVYCEWKRRAPEADPDATVSDSGASDDGEAEAAKAEAAKAEAEAAEEDEDLVWILPYKKNNAVACASNVKSVVETAQQELLRLDLVHGDDVKYWEAVVGQVSHPAKLRLDDVVASMKAIPDSAPPGDEGEKKDKDSEAVASFLDFASRHDEEEPARINLLESVVPRALDSAPLPAGAGGAADADAGDA